MWQWLKQEFNFADWPLLLYCCSYFLQLQGIFLLFSALKITTTLFVCFFIVSSYPKKWRTALLKDYMTNTLRFLCFPLNASIPHYLYTVYIEGNILARRLRVVPHFSPGTVERAWKSPHARKGDTRRGERKFFHARLRFARSTIPEEKWGTTRSLIGARRYGIYLRVLKFDSNRYLTSERPSIILF